VIHALFVPLFLAGTLAVPASVVAHFALAPVGVLLMIVAVVVQGRGHSFEANRPAPFKGRSDFLVRLFVEQWVTFPRFVLSGGYARAWRQAA
jgi:hypothetical protein